MKILWTIMMAGSTISIMEIFYFSSTEWTWVEPFYDYGESGDCKPEQKNARVQTSMYEIFYYPY